MIKFLEDTVVIPRESQWFGFYRIGQTQEILAYNETALYIEDWIGLKSLDEAGKLDFVECPGGHTQWTNKFFKKLVDTYLRN